MAEVWPPSLPQDHFIGLTTALPDVLIRTKMDAGPDKVRRRFTGNARPVRTFFVGTETQVKTFRDFFNTTLKGGSLSFEWDDPIGDATVLFRFKAPPPPTITLLVGNTDHALAKWRVDLELEILP